LEYEEGKNLVFDEIQEKKEDQGLTVRKRVLYENQRKRGAEPPV